MKQCTVTLKSLSPYSQSRYHNTPKLKGEQPGAWEERTWATKAHISPDGIIEISPMAIAGCIKEAAKFMSMKIPGRGNETWTKHFESGILVLAPMSLGVNIKDARKHAVFCSSDGKPGGKSRVMRFFPTVDEWKGKVDVTILDDMITEEIFSEVVATAGNLIGLGSFRVRNRGYFGRFEMVSIKWAGQP
jgi:hypothetical protein